jgi:hypothetical protein
LHDVIESTGRRPAGGRFGRLRGVPRAARRLTGGPVRPVWWVLGLVAVTAGLVALRLGLPDPAPVPWSASVTLDRQPGRQPIPAPVPVAGDGDVVEGELPIEVLDDGQTAETAGRAVRMVLGRYCLSPGTLTLNATESGAVGFVVRVSEPRTGRLIAVVVLYPNGRHGNYTWRGWLDQLRNCP